MKKLNISSEHMYLIESVVRDSAKFDGNEDLLDLFIDAIYKKSYLVLDAIRDVKRLKKHLATIADGCIEQVIKESEKYNAKKVAKVQPQNEPVSLKKTPFMQKETVESNKDSNDIVVLKEEIQRSEKYDAADLLIDPLDFCQKKRVSEYTLEKLIEIVKEIEQQYPLKRYFEIFSYRYIKNYNQTDTAREMKISQVELSKRFVEMIGLVRDQL